MIKNSIFTICSMILTCILTFLFTYNYLTKFNDGTRNLEKVIWRQYVNLNDKNRVTLRSKILVGQLQHEIKQLKFETDRIMRNLSLIDETPIPSKKEWKKMKRSLGGP